MTITAGVAAGHPATAQAGGDILAAGGSAADAAAAMVLTSCAAETLFTGLGGGGFAIHYEAATGQTRCLDFFVSIPGLGGRSPGRGQPIEVVFVGQAIPYEIGPPTVAVPGIPAGVLHLWRRWGRLPWTEVVAPGRTASLGSVFPSTHADLLPKVSPAFHVSDGIAVYSRPDGSTLQAGDLVAHPAHPQAYDLLAAEPEAFYRGEYAKAVLDVLGDTSAMDGRRPRGVPGHREQAASRRRARFRRAGPGRRPRRRARHHAGRRGHHARRPAHLAHRRPRPGARPAGAGPAGRDHQPGGGRRRGQRVCGDHQPGPGVGGLGARFRRPPELDARRGRAGPRRSRPGDADGLDDVADAGHRPERAPRGGGRRRGRQPDPFGAGAVHAPDAGAHPTAGRDRRSAPECGARRRTAGARLLRRGLASARGRRRRGLGGRHAGSVLRWGVGAQLARRGCRSAAFRARRAASGR